MSTDSFSLIDIVEARDQHRDFRWREKATNRQRKQSQKYYGYRGVKPSWIGQKYYTLVLVPSEDTTNTQKTDVGLKRRRSRETTKHSCAFPARLPTIDEHKATAETDQAQHPELCDFCPNTFWFSWHIDNYTSLCASEARANKSLTNSPNTLADLSQHLRSTNYTLNPYALDDDNDAVTFTYKRENTSPFPPNTTVSLALRTWTKHDNFSVKDNGIYPLDRRHHRGKQYREKSSWKESGKKLIGQRYRFSYESEDQPRLQRAIMAPDFRRYIDQDKGWGSCCERCQVEVDIDNHMTAEFQTHEECMAARAETIEWLKPLRLAEGNYAWWVIHGDDKEEWWEEEEEEEEEEEQQAEQITVAKEEQVQTNKNVDVEDNVKEEEEDAWSGIMVRSMVSWAGLSTPPATSEVDALSERNSWFDAEWEVLPSSGNNRG